MTVTHRANEQLLMGYAAGILPEAFDLIVATQASICDETRAELSSYEAIGGALLENVDDVALSGTALENVLNRIADPQKRSITMKPHIEGVFPKPLQDYVGGDVDTVKWRNLGGGVKQAILKTDNRASARLLYIPAGKAVPDHGHQGTELTLVLQGAFKDEVARFARGDLEIADEDLEHTPVAEEGLDCICLAATDAPLRFKGLLPRLLQPFFKI